MAYGNGGAAVGIQRADRPETAPVEQLSSIHQTAIANLIDAKGALDVLLDKVRGEQPADPLNKAVELHRHVLNDAYTVRDLSHQIVERINELHRVIGHEK